MPTVVVAVAFAAVVAVFVVASVVDVNGCPVDEDGDEVVVVGSSVGQYSLAYVDTVSTVVDSLVVVASLVVVDSVTVAFVTASDASVVVALLAATVAVGMIVVALVPVLLPLMVVVVMSTCATATAQSNANNAIMLGEF